jgi:hypothetical protein
MGRRISLHDASGPRLAALDDMRSSPFRFLFVCLALSTLWGCSGGSPATSTSDAGADTAGAETGRIADSAPPEATPDVTVSDAGAPKLLTIDCTANDPMCPAIGVEGDPLEDSNANGYADPSMRRDPVTGTLWMSYSFREQFSTSGASKPTKVIETHLASSTDNGMTWNYTGLPLFTYSQVTTDADGLGPLPLPYYSSHEVSNLYPVDMGGTVIWVIVYKYYTVVQGGGPFHLPDGGVDFPDFTASSMLVLAAGAPGASPATLGTAPSVSLGAEGTKNTVDLNLSSLTGGAGFDLTTCAQFDEPALMMMPGDSHLYLAAFCLPLTAGGNVDYPAGSYVVFSTLPSSAPPNTWSWAFEGVLAGPSDAALLGSGSQYWWELDLAKKADGTLLAVVSPASASSSGGGVGGCEVIEIGSLAPPSLGSHVELAAITTTDNTAGDACTYEPTSDTGVVIFRGPFAVSGGNTTTINATGLRP